MVRSDIGQPCVLRPLVRWTILCTMRKIGYWLLIILLGSAAIAQDSSGVVTDRQQLIQYIQSWVADQEGVESHQVDVAAMDRRLKVPNCTNQFVIQYPYATSKNTVQVTCPDLSWKVFVSIKVNKPQSVLVYTRNISANQLLKTADVKLKAILTSERGLFTDLESVLNNAEQYSLTTAVKKGDLVRKTHLLQTVKVYSLNRDILRGEAVKPSDVTALSVSLASSYPNQRFPISLLDHAKAARDLSKNSVLSRRDFNVRYQVLMTTAAIARGQKITSANARSNHYFGDLPNDAALKLADVAHMEATRTLKADQLIRLSDLRASAMFNRGDSVELTISKGLLTVTVDMLAQEQGRMGQQVNLLNPESNETVRAIVTGPGKAQGL